MSNDELTAQREREYASFIRYSSIGVVAVSILLAIVIVGFVA